MTTKQLLGILIICLFILLPAKSFAAGALMSLSSSAGVYSSGKDLTTSLIINSGGGQGINAAESVVKFDPKQLKVKKIDKTGSIFELWPKGPKIDNVKGTITFDGGRPTAFKATAGLVFKITFTPQKAGTFNIKIASSTSYILAADGYATNILAEATGASFIFGNAATVTKAEALRTKLSGKILLPLSTSSPAWYVNPTDRKRYAFTSTTTILNLVRVLGTKVSHSYIIKYQKTIFPKAVFCKILVDTTDKNKAYYVSTDGKKLTFLDQTANLYTILTSLGTKISSADLNKLPDWSI